MFGFFFFAFLFQINNLKPDTPYVFIIRAENSYGVSVPSEMSDIVHTLGEKSVTAEHTLAEARGRLSGKVIVLKELVSETSTSVKVTWEVSRRFCFLWIVGIGGGTEGELGGVVPRKK